MTGFRHITADELYKVRMIAYATWPDTFGMLLPAAQIDDMLNHIYNEASLLQQLQQGHQFILAEKEADTVGFCSYEINCAESRQCMIHKLYLLPAVQGIGIGTQFLNRIADIARQHNDTSLRLNVFYLNRKAIRFYLKYGFRQTGTATTPFGNYDAITDYIMIKEL